MENKWVGSCHCGKVKYEAKADIKGVVSCNCSICMRSGTLLTFVPSEDFTLLSGEDALADYQFNKHVIHHLFCTTCGVRSFARGVGPDGKPMVAINVRCLEGIDLESLDVMHYDGRNA
jgi:hypothetical protein